MAMVPWVAACGLFSDDDGPRVLVVGDSVTRLAADQLREKMSWAEAVDIKARDGDRTDQLLAAARRGVDASPDIGIFMPGYNDILQNRAETDALAAMIALAAEVECSVWLLIPEDGGYSTSQVRTWNQRVRAAADKHSSLHVERDWKRLVERSPSFTFVSQLDAVHPNKQGREAVAEVMSTAAQRRCR
jgi:hypothetical protein